MRILRGVIHNSDLCRVCYKCLRKFNRYFHYLVIFLQEKICVAYLKIDNFVDDYLQERTCLIRPELDIDTCKQFPNSPSVRCFECRR